MSVSKTNFYEQHVPSTGRDEIDSHVPKAPPTDTKNHSSKSSSKFSIDSIVNSHRAKPADGRPETQSGYANPSSISTSRPSMVPGMPVTPPDIQGQTLNLRQTPHPSAFLTASTTGMIPAVQCYPSSYPVLKSHPITPNQSKVSMAIAPHAVLHAIPTMPNDRPAFTLTSHGSLTMTDAPFQTPFDFRQPADQTSTGGEPPLKRRRMNEASNAANMNSSGRTVELPVWHETKLVLNEDPTPYMEFLDLKNAEGEIFVKAIFSMNQRYLFEHFIKKVSDKKTGDSDEVSKARADFVEKMFSYLSKAIEKRQLGMAQITDEQLGKLVVASFRIAARISRFFVERGKKNLVNPIVSFCLNFFNKNHCIAPYVRDGIQFNHKDYSYMFGGKKKFELLLWCSEQGTTLTSEELHFLSNEVFSAKLAASALLKKLRERVKEQQKD